MYSFSIGQCAGSQNDAYVCIFNYTGNLFGNAKSQLYVSPPLYEVDESVWIWSCKIYYWFIYYTTIYTIFEQFDKAWDAANVPGIWFAQMKMLEV